MSNYPGALSGGFVSHRFVSLKSDQPDLSVINPSNWNQSHIIGSGAIQSGALGASAVNSGNLAANSVTSGVYVIGSGAIQSGMFGALAIGSGSLASGSVVVGSVSSGAVSSGAIGSGASLWNTNLGGKPFVLVTPNGPTDGGDFGPNTSGTLTGGIQEAINFLANNPTPGFGNMGGSVHIRYGTYNISGQISWPTVRILLEGEGRGTILYQRANMPGGMFVNQTSGDGSAAGGWMRNFQAFGNGLGTQGLNSGANTQSYFFQGRTFDMTFSDLFISNFPNGGLFFTRNGGGNPDSPTWVNRCFIESNGASGNTNAVGLYTYQANDIWVSDCWFDQNFNSVSMNLVAANRIINSFFADIYGGRVMSLDGMRNCIVEGNYIDTSNVATPQNPILIGNDQGGTLASSFSRNTIFVHNNTSGGVIQLYNTNPSPAPFTSFKLADNLFEIPGGITVDEIFLLNSGIQASGLLIEGNMVTNLGTLTSGVVVNYPGLVSGGFISTGNIPSN